MAFALPAPMGWRNDFSGAWFLIIALAGGCGPQLGSDANAEDTDGGTEAEPDTETDGDSVADTDTTGDEVECQPPVGDTPADATPRTIRLRSASAGPIYVDTISCSGQPFRIEAGDAVSPSCRFACEQVEPGWWPPTCDHCAYSVIKLMPDAVYEEEWSGLLREPTDLDAACEGGSGDRTCGLLVAPAQTVTVSVVASPQMSCSDGGPQQCDCDASDRGWCLITQDAVVSQGVVSEALVDPSEDAPVQLVIGG